MRRFLIFLLMLLSDGSCDAAPRIAEFQARNSSTLADGDGEFSDWIEIYNPGPGSVALSEWKLTDDPDRPDKWIFPELSLAEGESLVVWASGKNRRNPAFPLHTGFQLTSRNGYLALRTPAGDAVSVWENYPLQFTDISYGSGAGGMKGYFTGPTPGTHDDGMVLTEAVAVPGFSAPGGFAESPLQVSVTSPTPGAAIRYTTDGSEPTAESAVLSGPLAVTTTTVLRVRGFREGWLPSLPSTRTWIFPVTWKDQPDFPAGFSTTWGMYDSVLRSSADYGMNRAVTQHPVLGAQVIPAMTTTLPVVAVTGDAEEIFGDSGIHGSLRLTGGEVPVAVEYFDPLHPEDRWEVRAALNAHGGAVRNFPKKAFRLDFTGRYGDGELKAPLFAGSAVESFDQLVLRGGGHDSFTARVRGGSPDANDLAWHASYLRDQFLRRTEVEAGLISPHGKYVHLSMNGLYWGIYDLHERPNGEFFARHGGGDPSEWDVIHHGLQVVDGSADAWGELMALAKSGVHNDAEYEVLAALTGPDRWIDHLLIRMWAADHDWLGPVTMPSSTLGTTGDVAYYKDKNWYAGRRSGGGAPGPWNLFTWDGEISMGSHVLHRWLTTTQPAGLDFPSFRELRLDMTGIAQPFTPGEVWNSLKSWPAFRRKVGDRAWRLLGPGGVLHPLRAAGRVESIRQQLDLPMLAESARWGTVSGFSVASLPNGGGLLQKWDNDLLTRDQHWRPEVAWLRDVWCVERHPLFLAQLRGASLFPATAPPELIPHGGPLSGGQALQIHTAAGEIRYTVDGSDPSDPGPGVRVWPAGSNQLPEGPFLLRARVWQEAAQEWSALVEARYNPALPATPGTLVLSEIHYHPANPTAEEVAAGYVDDSQFEFLELYNASTSLLDLSGLRFASGIDFDFQTDASITLLAPGQRLLIVADPAAFAMRYGAALAVSGTFANGTNLSNGGERLKLVSASGSILAETTYGDSGDWPAAADGSGASLVLLDPSSGITGTSPDAWRASPATSGSPGTGEVAMTYAQWVADYFSPGEQNQMGMAGPQDDPDRDGVVNLFEYLLVKQPRKASPRPPLSLSSSGGKIRFSWEVRRGAQDAGPDNPILELGGPAGGFAPASSLIGLSIVRTPTGEGTDLCVVELDPATNLLGFGRLKASLP